MKDFIIFQTTGWRRYSFYDQGQWQLRGDIIREAENYEPPQEVYNVESQIYANVVSLESVRQYLANRNYTSLWIPGLDFYEVLMIDPYFQPRSKDLQKIIDLERSLFGNDPLYLMTSAKRQRDQLGGKKHGVDFLSGEGDGHPTITEVKQYLESKMPQYLSDRSLEFLDDNQNNFKWASKSDQQKFYGQQQEKWHILPGNSRSLWLD